MITDKHIYQISQLNCEARLLLENHFSMIYVTGEISNMARPSSGHLYFTLKDASAQIRCALFKNRLSRDSAPLENGMQIVARAKISLYEGRGDYQLIIDYAEEVGSGNLQRAFDELKKSLEQRGWFDPAIKKSLPEKIHTVGLITSSTGAAVRDVLATLRRRFAGLNVIIYPCEVQGKQSAPSIAKQIQTAARRNECDVIILTRGGGSLEDLWGFNEEIVAGAIRECPIPIISAVGHEIDFTIADFVADIRAATPTAAAELVSPDCEHFIRILEQNQRRLTYLINTQIQQVKSLFSGLQKRLKHPGQRIRESVQRLDELDIRLSRIMALILKQKQYELKSAVEILDSLNPLAVLKRGYSVIYREKQVISSQKQLTSKDKLVIHFHDGNLNVTVD